MLGNEPQQQQKQANLIPPLPDLGPIRIPFLRPPIGEPPVDIPPVGVNPTSTLLMIDAALLAYDIDAALKLYQTYAQSKDPPPAIEPTPKTNPSLYEPVRGKPAKRNKITGEIWEKDKARHGGEHYEVYRNKRDYENSKRDRAVGENGNFIKSY